MKFLVSVHLGFVVLELVHVDSVGGEVATLVGGEVATRIGVKVATRIGGKVAIR